MVKTRRNGSAALEDAGVILDGHEYGICPGAPNPAEFELIDPPGGGNGIVIGVSGYDGSAKVKLSVGTRLIRARHASLQRPYRLSRRNRVLHRPTA